MEIELPSLFAEVNDEIIYNRLYAIKLLKRINWSHVPGLISNMILPVLFKQLKDKYWFIQWSAALTLDETVESLEKIDWNLKSNCLGLQGVLPLLTKSIKDDDRVVIYFAARILKCIDRHPVQSLKLNLNIT